MAPTGVWFTWAPTNFQGVVEFTYRITDGQGGLGEGTLRVTVDSGSTAKVLMAGLATQTVIREGLYELFGAAYSFDPELAVDYRVLLYKPDGLF